MINYQIIGGAAIGSIRVMFLVMMVLAFDNGGILNHQTFKKWAEQMEFDRQREAAFWEMDTDIQTHAALVLRNKEGGNPIFMTVRREVVDAHQARKGKCRIVDRNAFVEQFINQPVLLLIQAILRYETAFVVALADLHTLLAFVAQQFGMDIARMGRIKEVFDGVDKIAFHISDGLGGFKTFRCFKIGIRLKQYTGNQTDPHPIVVLLARKRRNIFRFFTSTHPANNSQNFALRIKLPAVITTLKLT